MLRRETGIAREDRPPEEITQIKSTNQIERVATGEVGSSKKSGKWMMEDYKEETTNPAPFLSVPACFNVWDRRLADVPEELERG